MKTNFKMRVLLTLVVAFVCSYCAFAHVVVKHTVCEGESLSLIAKKYNTTESAIISLNPWLAESLIPGMELMVSVKESERSSRVAMMGSASDRLSISLDDYSLPTDGKSDFEEKRNKSVFDLTYTASSFDDVKGSGVYGFSMTFLPWKIANRFYVGLNFSPFNLNAGLVDSNFISDLIYVGPAFGIYLSSTVFISIPINASCNILFGDDSNKTTWGMIVSPTLYLGKKGGLFFGPNFYKAFKGDSDVTCGFRTGIYF